MIHPPPPPPPQPPCAFPPPLLITFGECKLLWRGSNFSRLRFKINRWHNLWSFNDGSSSSCKVLGILKMSSWFLILKVISKVSQEDLLANVISFFSLTESLFARHFWYYSSFSFMDIVDFWTKNKKTNKHDKSQSYFSIIIRKVSISVKVFVV